MVASISCCRPASQASCRSIATSASTRPACVNRAGSSAASGPAASGPGAVIARYAAASSRHARASSTDAGGLTHGSPPSALKQICRTPQNTSTNRTRGHLCLQHRRGLFCRKISGQGIAGDRRDERRDHRKISSVKRSDFRRCAGPPDHCRTGTSTGRPRRCSSVRVVQIVDRSSAMTGGRGFADRSPAPDNHRRIATSWWT